MTRINEGFLQSAHHFSMIQMTLPLVARPKMNVLVGAVALALSLFAVPFGSTVAGEPTQKTARSEGNGLELRTHHDDRAIAEGTLVARWKGPIDHPLASRLATLVSDVEGRYGIVLLDLDSEGGRLAHVRDVLRALAELRRKADLQTRVAHGARCLSACIPVFMQGRRRIAGGASAWLLHGACAAYTNVPAAQGTREYLAILREAGVSDDFLCGLERQGVFTRPGAYWASGYELFHRLDAGIITELLPAWQPEEPAMPPFDPQLGPR